mgnify:CR=1 FL=1
MHQAAGTTKNWDFQKLSKYYSELPKEDCAFAQQLYNDSDDEFDSDDDAQPAKADSDNEIEDEAALVDKMLKDRYLNRTEIPAEDFTDSENEEEDNATDDYGLGMVSNNLTNPDDKCVVLSSLPNGQNFSKRPRFGEEDIEVISKPDELFIMEREQEKEENRKM